MEGFGSLRKARVGELDDHVPVIGMNGTGKSNLLRALDLFFDETVEANDGPSTSTLTSPTT